ncbi:thioesterase domain-containing protein [Winogradskyella sediminis]|uniref:thioesterase domain-containing protein n=1 Tax=Winogradskyella sediminis TaxID=1382466 RepID=UPI000E27BD87|nr:thioesterase domain-containing protein [Winogradskyella sediminis]REG87912.1 thioesterase domain-containing protein [Winogradskyella sediminis]
MEPVNEYNILQASDLSFWDGEFTFYSLIPLQPNGHKAPLFIVHGADYNVLKFSALADVLGNDQPIYALQAKGQKGEVQPHNRVEEMASRYILEIEYITQGQPFVLGGFSFGGIIAYEMVKQLKAQGKSAKKLLLFDSYVYPTYYYSHPRRKKMVSWLYLIAQLGFMGFNMFSSVPNFKRRVHLLKIKCRGVYLKFKHGSETQYQLQFNRSAKIDEEHTLAYQKYHIVPQPIKVHLFWSTKKLYFAHDYNCLGWKNIALAGVQKYILPGNHSEMFLYPVVEELGAKLKILLNNDD